MLNIIRSTFVCLLMLWLPALQAADSGWLQSPTNDHAKVRLRADTSQPGETRLLLAIELQKAGKPTGVRRGRRHCAGNNLAKQSASGDLVLAYAAAF